MKNIFKKLSLAFAVILFASCDKDLDQLPYDGFPIEFAYSTSADFENAIRGAYQTLYSASVFGSSDAGSMLSAPDVMSDNVTPSQYGRGTKQGLHIYNYSPSTSPLSGLYQTLYNTIYRANLILFYADSYEGANKATIEAEAKALRGLAHFYLVSYWGKIPTQSGDANDHLGVAYVTVVDPNQLPARENVGDVYSKIIDDLTDARSGVNPANPVGRFNADAINLILSRVYLYMGQWQNAADAANNVSESVASRSNVVGIWQDESQDGLVFYIPNILTPPASPGVTWSQGGLSNIIPEYVVSYDFYNSFEADDIRLEAYTIPAVTIDGGINIPVNAIKKLLGRGNATNGQVDWKIFRAEEAYLNKAEALFNLGQEGPARAALDAVRNERYTSYAGGETGTALRDAIRLERRFEFAFEYQRYFDLKRWGESLERTNHGDIADGSGTPSDLLNLPASSTLWQLPISQSALDQNTNMVQNPGY